MNNIYKYTDYRDFLRDFIIENGLTQLGFISRYNCNFSHVTLRRTLSKSTSQISCHSIRDLHWSEILRKLKVPAKKAEYLVLLKTYNDKQNNLKDDDLYLKSLKKTLNRLKSTSKSNSTYSRDGLLVGKAYDSISMELKRKLLKDVISLLLVCERGQKAYAIENNIRALIEKLTNALRGK